MFDRYELSTAELVRMREAEGAGAPFAAYRDGGGGLVIHRFAEVERLTVGRHSDSDIVLAWDDSVSRLHAIFERLGGAWTLLDDGLSSHGSFVNGERVSTRQRLGDRDAIRVGRTEILFREPSAAGATELGFDTTKAADPASLARITPAQRRVLIALCRPYAERGTGAAPASNQEIATELTLSLDAVRTHLKALFRELEVPDVAQNYKRVELARRALQAGLVTERELKQ